MNVLYVLFTFKCPRRSRCLSYTGCVLPPPVVDVLHVTHCTLGAAVHRQPGLVVHLPAGRCSPSGADRMVVLCFKKSTVVNDDVVSLMCLY